VQWTAQIEGDAHTLWLFARICGDGQGVLRAMRDRNDLKELNYFWCVSVRKMWRKFLAFFVFWFMLCLCLIWKYAHFADFLYHCFEFGVLVFIVSFCCVYWLLFCVKDEKVCFCDVFFFCHFFF